jgi:hypothetical protein
MLQSGFQAITMALIWGGYASAESTSAPETAATQAAVKWAGCINAPDTRAADNLKSRSGATGTSLNIALTSQNWHRSIWQHDLQAFIPAKSAASRSCPALHPPAPQGRKPPPSLGTAAVRPPAYCNNPQISRSASGKIRFAGFTRRDGFDEIDGRIPNQRAPGLRLINGGETVTSSRQNDHSGNRTGCFSNQSTRPFQVLTGKIAP